MVTLRNSPFSENAFRRRITVQSTSIVLPRRALERDHPKNTMAAVPDFLPEPERPDKDVPLADSPPLSGLKPIERLTSDTRIARINPESDTTTVLRYSSQFARDYIRSDYNFCAAKI